MIKKEKVLILTGGKGQRFNPFSFVIPKPLMPLNETPILRYLIESFKKYNFRKFLISTGYQSELVKAYLGSGKKLNIQVKYYDEKKPLGTAGPITLIRKNIKLNEYFFLINGDIFTYLNFDKMLNFAKKNKFDLVVGYIKKSIKNRYGVLKIKKNKLEKIVEKPTTYFDISSGIYLIKNKKSLNLIPRNKFFSMPDLINIYLKKNLLVGAYEIKDYWLSIENMENLISAEKKIRNR